MKNKVFLHHRWLRRIYFLLFFSLFISIKLVCFEIIIFSFILYLFRRKKINKSLIERADDSLLFAPATGRISLSHNEESKVVFIKTKLLKGFDIVMPAQGEVLDYKKSINPVKFGGITLLKKVEICLLMKLVEIGDIKLRLHRTGIVFHPRVWVRSGDRALLGSTLGYLPFGGKLTIEIKKDMKVLLKDKDNTEVLATLLASMRND